MSAWIQCNFAGIIIVHSTQPSQHRCTCVSLESTENARRNLHRLPATSMHTVQRHEHRSHTELEHETGAPGQCAVCAYRSPAHHFGHRRNNRHQTAAPHRIQSIRHNVETRERPHARETSGLRWSEEKRASEEEQARRKEGAKS